MEDWMIDGVGEAGGTKAEEERLTPNCAWGNADYQALRDEYGRKVTSSHPEDQKKEMAPAESLRSEHQ